MTQSAGSTQSFDPRATLDLYRAGRFEEVTEIFIRVLDFLSANFFRELNDSDQYFINSFLKTFLYILTQPDFKVPDAHITRMVLHNHMISNLLAISIFKNSDPYLDILRGQPSNFVAILTLYSARNTVQFDRKSLFDTSPQLASIWYLQYASAFYSSLASEVGWKNLKEHFEFSHPGLFVWTAVQEIYFGSTYVDGKCDRLIKSHINGTIQKITDTLPPIKNKPNPNKLALISATWHKTHSVYRNYFKFIELLKTKYDITFFDFAHYTPSAERGFFNRSHSLKLAPNGALDLAPLLDNDFQMVIFPDVGMCAESIFLANCRLAPIQMCMPGHSVSTFGAKVDYFFSGADVEPPVKPEENYSERLVLLPGMGVIHNTPLYKPRGIRGTHTDHVAINCAWFSQKVNYPFLQTLKKLIARSKKKIVLSFFVGVSSLRKNDFFPFHQELNRQLGDSARVLPGLSYDDYMARMEVSDLSLDSFHFGGCNTISDSLFLRLPTITWDGARWYARIGSQMLRLVGMEECVATNEEEYLAIALKMIEDDEYRADVRARLNAVDLNATIYSTAEAKYYVNGVDYVIKNHEKLIAEGSREPIRIPRD
ncbi:hypothetical protein BH10PLA1_BH10PLA1_20570 [soil metagenome]